VILDTARTILQGWNAKDAPTDLQDELRSVVRESAVLKQAFALEAVSGPSDKEGAQGNCQMDLVRSFSLET